ncbi:MAG: RNA polymerase sigma factor [Lachnospiraceae bacterium]|jgi:RNA polymerase sigma-70 factor (ECF subfamily)|nr:RNA polymerase sigma factor [Lachnospiraceae bacterium]MCX4315312.1 RNA polymerase sigma factor [Lachnospiraceae bacterium]
METMVLERMIDQYQNLIFSICYRIVGDYFEAQDLTQETFLAAYRNLDSFDGANEKAWLTRIATNKCLDYQKQAARRLIPTEDTSLNAITDSWSDGSSPPETHYMEKEVRRQLYQTCSSLKPPYNEIALEYFYQERTVEEIAKKHGKNKKTIQTQVYRARDLLRKHYRKEADAV